MKRLALVVLLCLSSQAFAAEVLLGTIVSTTTKNNSDTAVPFTIGGNNRILVQCDVAAYLVLGTTTSTASTSATGVAVDALEKWETVTGSETLYLAVIAVAGSGTTATCKVFGVR